MAAGNGLTSQVEYDGSIYDVTLGLCLRLAQNKKKTRLLSTLASQGRHKLDYYRNIKHRSEAGCVGMEW